MGVLVPTITFYMLGRSRALVVPPRENLTAMTPGDGPNGISGQRRGNVLIPDSGMTCTASSEWTDDAGTLRGCDNVFIDSNDQYPTWTDPTVNDGTYVWVANNEQQCAGIWIKVILDSVYDIQEVAFRQRYSPFDQGDGLEMTFYDATDAVVHTRTESFAVSNTGINNPAEETFPLSPTVNGVKSIKFEYTGGQTVGTQVAGCGANGGYLGAKRIKVWGLTASSTTASPSATGDPHLQNVHGERFDLMIPGKHTLVQIPRGERNENALLLVQAEARRFGEHCAEIYFTELNVTGSWAYAKQPGGYQYVSKSVAQDNAKWVDFGNVKLKVVQGHTESGFPYLNFYVKHLGRAGFAVGGLLGEDDNADVSAPLPECSRILRLSSDGQGPQGGLKSSFAVATFA